MDATFTSSPSVKNDLLDEITEQDYVTASGGNGWGISGRAGNRGRFCTFTQECMRVCN